MDFAAPANGRRTAVYCISAVAAARVFVNAAASTDSTIFSSCALAQIHLRVFEHVHLFEGRLHSRTPQADVLHYRHDATEELRAELGARFRRRNARVNFLIRYLEALAYFGGFEPVAHRGARFQRELFLERIRSAPPSMVTSPSSVRWRRSREPTTHYPPGPRRCRLSHLFNGQVCNLRTSSLGAIACSASLTTSA